MLLALTLFGCVHNQLSGGLVSEIRFRSGTPFDSEGFSESWLVGATRGMRLIQAKRASEVLSVSLARLYELARLGVIPVVRLGPRQIRFDEDALTEWVKNGGLAVEGNGSVQLSEVTRGGSRFAETQ